MVTMFLMKYSSLSHMILQNKHQNPIIYGVHTSTQVNDYTKYEQDPFIIVGCRVVTMEVQTGGLQIPKCHKILEYKHRNPII